jgi:hypothetical protein
MSDADPWPNLEEVVESIEVKLDDLTEVSHAKQAFHDYASIVTTDTELHLDTLAEAEVYTSQLEAIMTTALVFTQMESDFDHPSLKKESHDKKLWHALKDLDAYRGGTKLTKAKKSQMREFIRHAHHADEKMTIEEVIDLAAHEDSLVEAHRPEIKASCIKGARLLMERHSVEPTQQRIEALARRAEAARLARFREE